MTECIRYGHLCSLIEFGDCHFDPATGLLRLPSVEITQITNTGSKQAFPLLESAWYAFALLELAERPRMGRADAILQRVFKCKNIFIDGRFGMVAALVWLRHRNRLSISLIEILRNSLEFFGDEAIRRHHAAIGFRSVSADMEDIFSLLAAGELLLRDDLLSQGRTLLSFVSKQELGYMMTGMSSPFNGNATASSVIVLHAIENHIRDVQAKKMASELLAQHWHIIFQKLRLHGPDIFPPNDLIALLIVRVLDDKEEVTHDLDFQLPSGVHMLSFIHALVLGIHLPTCIRMMQTAG